MRAVSLARIYQWIALKQHNNLKNSDEFAQPMQDFINDHGWGSTWQRGGIDLKTRSLVTIAMLTALRTPQELKGHIRGALNNGATIEEIREVLLHSAVYCGAPAAQEAFRAAKEVLNND
jgi:4-carboxymuconolactone decarboxylase